MRNRLVRKGLVLGIIVLFVGSGFVSSISCVKEVYDKPITSDYKVGIKWNAAGVSSNEIAAWFSGCILRVWDNNFLYKIDNTNWTEIEVYGDTTIDYNHSSGIYFSGDSNTEALCRIVHSDYIPYDDYYLIEMKPQFVSGWGAIGIIFNFQDDDNFNEIFLSWNNICHITYHQFIDGEIDGYWEIETSLSSGTYDLKLEVNNTDGTCKIYVDGELKGVVDIRLPPDIVYVDDDFDENTSGWGYDHFDNIQDGIDAVNENGDVYVYDGTYYENVDITKDGINLIGEDKLTTIVDGYQNGYSILIKNQQHVNVSGFTVRNGTKGVLIRAESGNSRYNTISDCILYNNIWDGGMIHAESHTSAYAEYNVIKDCIAGYNGHTGIAIHITKDGAVCRYNQIYNCNVLNNSLIGIRVDANGNGILNDNVIYHNNVFNNINNAKGQQSNEWDQGYPSGGNYWDDYNGTDSDGDGIGDTPYPIYGGDNEDNYPLMHWFGPPYANFTYDNETSEFDASLSGDYNGEIINWNWIFGDGTNGTGEIIIHKYCTIGTYDVTLTVTDDDGLTANITKSVEVTKANIPPSVEIYGPNSGKPGEEYEYVFIITDPDNNDLYLWVDWGDGDSTGWMGPLGSGEPIKFSHTWNESGIYVIKVKVKDDCDESEWAEFEVEIPRNRMSLFLRLFERFLDVFPLIRLLFRVGGIF